MNKALLAIDVGGSTSRASLVDEAGRCLGRGRSRGGNPASNDPALAASAIVSAAEAAVADAGAPPYEITIALIAMAGPRAHAAQTRLEDAFRALGLTGAVVFAPDLSAMFSSVTAAPDGYCIVAGTGSGAVRLRAGVIEGVVDAAGWLLGDLGSGYWLGHQAAIAVAAALEGRGEPTSLTAAILDSLGIPQSDERASDGRSVSLRLFIDAIYAMRPIELARFAPLVLARRDDPVAARLLAQAVDYLVADFRMVFDPQMPGPVALGGGIAAHLNGLPDAIAGVVRAAGHEPDIRLAGDGSVGAIVLAMRAVGLSVDEATIKTVAASVAARNPAPVLA